MDGTVSYVFFTFTTSDGSTLTIVSAYITSGDTSLVQATDDTTTFVPTGKDRQSAQNAFYCKAFTTTVSVSAKATTEE